MGNAFYQNNNVQSVLRGTNRSSNLLTIPMVSIISDTIIRMYKVRNCLPKSVFLAYDILIFVINKKKNRKQKRFITQY